MIWPTEFSGYLVIEGAALLQLSYFGEICVYCLSFGCERHVLFLSPTFLPSKLTLNTVELTCGVVVSYTW